MDTLTARPQLLKQANLSMIRKVLKTKGTATRAELAYETKISSTTVRALLEEMLKDGEIKSVGYDESSGGRKAERYRFSPDRYHSVAFCIQHDQSYAILLNICGEIVETTRLRISEDDIVQALIDYLDDIVSRKEIKSIGIGAPGVVKDDCFWIQDRIDGQMRKVDIAAPLSERYGIPMILENDLNATTVGYARGLEKNIWGVESENINMAYLHLEKGCVSAGFIAGGRIIRGNNNFAGEISLIPMKDGKPMDVYMAGPMDDEQYIHNITTIISWICGILNPKYVVLSGIDLRMDCINPIIGNIADSLPKHMRAEILYSPDIWQDYLNGMAYLTSKKMFEDIQFIQE